jgi:class 3 adenylate cyclase
MFSDLVGSTALSARMDPEDLREIISAYHKCVAEIVHRCDGFVAQYLGDGVLVYFGYPQAHEDDAERAVRAGLELIAAVYALKTRVSLQTRVGIATGLVVVGDLLGAGGAQERGIVGETPNLAARLQGIAEPNMVVIAESTRKLLGNLFDLEDLGARELKGIARSVRAWAALRTSAVESRFSGKANGFDWDVEAMGQNGGFADKTIRAWAVGSLAGYTFNAVYWKPRLGLQFDAASGNRDPNSNVLQTFNPLFPNGAYFTHRSSHWPSD